MECFDANHYTAKASSCLGFSIAGFGDNVTVAFSKKGKAPDAEAVKDAVLRVVSTSGCEEIIKDKIPLFSVDTFLGANSLQSLVSLSGTEVMRSKTKKELLISSTITDEVLNNWIVSETKSPIDDSPTVSMIKIADSGDQSLILRCKEDSTDAYIRTNNFLGEDSTNVTVRYDLQKAQKQIFSLSTDNKALFFSPAIVSIKKMIRSKNVVFRYHTYRGTSNTVSFTMNDLKNKIKPLRTACHW